MKANKESLGMVSVVLIGGPLDGQVREVPVNWFLDGRSRISFEDYPEPARYANNGRLPCRMTPIKQYDYQVHYNGTHVSLRYEQ